MKKTIRMALKDSIPVMSGYVVIGITFGILLKKAGYGIIWALLCSIFVYAGSMQFVLITLLTSGASLITVALTTLTVNARHLFYGLSMIEKYQSMGKAKNYLIFSLTDETYSLVCDRATDKKYYLTLSLLNQMYWILGTCIGSILGSIIPFNITGIDFAMTALFIVVVVEQWLSSKKHTPTIIGFMCSLICLYLFGDSYFLIPTMIIILISLSLLYKKEKGNANG